MMVLGTSIVSTSPLQLPQPPTKRAPLHPGHLHRRHTPITCSTQDGRRNGLISLTVNAATELLKVAGVGAATSPAASPTLSSATLRKGDVAGVLRELRFDYGRQYFVTGLVSDAIYDPDCYFADPTVSFRGRELYKRNLLLVAPFLWDATIQLRSLTRKASAPGGVTQLLAEWRLCCWVRLPWAPHVDINGTTTYTLNADKNQIVSHVEEWGEVSAVQALLLLLKPSERAVWRRRRGGS